MSALIFNFRIFLVLLLVSVSGYAYGDFGELSSIAAGLGLKQEDEKKTVVRRNHNGRSSRNDR